MKRTLETTFNQFRSWPFYRIRGYYYVSGLDLAMDNKSFNVVIAKQYRDGRLLIVGEKMEPWVLLTPPKSQRLPPPTLCPT